MSKQFQDAVFIPGGKRSTSTVGILGMIVVVDGLSVIAGIFRFYAFGKPDISEEIADVIDFSYCSTGCVQVLLQIACAVAFSMWFHRAYKNLYSLQVNNLMYSPGRAVASFFIPIINLFRPYRVAKEIWWASGPISSDESQGRSKDQPVITTWWALFLIAGVVANVAARAEMSAMSLVSLDQLQRATGLMLIGDLLSGCAALAAIRVVIGINSRQTKRYRELTEAGENQGPPHMVR